MSDVTTAELDGSLLGPVLFLLYVSNLPDWYWEAFADDLVS
jgi:hypothetical protein